MLSSSAPLDPAVPFEGFSELPPGIYSLQLEQPCSQSCSGSGGSSGGGSGTCVPDPGSKLRARYQQHGWSEASVRQLTAFSRTPQLVEPPAARDGAQEAAGADGGAAGPAAAADCLAFEATVDAVMAALRQAVATRCRCIDECQSAAQAAAPGGGEPACGISSQLQQARLDSSPPGACIPGSSSSGGGGGGGGNGSSCDSRGSSAAPPLPLLLLPPAPVLILFSGGVDSTLLAALAHEALPPGVPIDLASVCFAGGTSPDRLSALDALEELRQLAPERQWRLIQARLGRGGEGLVGVLARLGGSMAVAEAWPCWCVHRPQSNCAAGRPLLTPPWQHHSAAGRLPPAPCRWTAACETWRRRSRACCACWPLLTQ